MGGAAFQIKNKEKQGGFIRLRGLLREKRRGGGSSTGKWKVTNRRASLHDFRGYPSELMHVFLQSKSLSRIFPHALKRPLFTMTFFCDKELKLYG